MLTTTTNTSTHSAGALPRRRGFFSGAAAGNVPWIDAERAVLREHYEKPGGIALCEALLPDRERRAIQNEASDLGLKAHRPRSVGRGGCPVPRWEKLLRALASIAPEHCGAVPLGALVERAFDLYPEEFGWRAPARDALLPDTHAVLTALHRAGPIGRGYARTLCEGVYGLSEEGRAAVLRPEGDVPLYAGDEALEAARAANLARAAEIRRTRRG